MTTRSSNAIARVKQWDIFLKRDVSHTVFGHSQCHIPTYEATASVKICCLQKNLVCSWVKSSFFP